MPRKLTHTFLNEQYPQSAGRTFEAKDIPVTINRPGKLNITVTARAKFRNMLPGNAGQRPVVTGDISLRWQLIDPLGVAFTKTDINLNDLDRYRDLRGFIRPWTLRIPKPVAEDLPGFIGFEPGKQLVSVKVNETIPVSSAAPLVNVTASIRPVKEYKFDLYRLGNLTVNVTRLISVPLHPDIQGPSAAKISLVKPDGTIHSTGRNGLLQVAITLKDLKWSRAANGKVQQWKLRIETAAEGKHSITAQVYETLTIPKKLLLDRLEYLLGKKGAHLELKANWSGSEQTNLFTLKAKSKILAENLDFYGFIDPSKTPPGYESVEEGIEYRIYDHYLGKKNDDNNLRCRNFKLDSLDIKIERSVLRTATKIEIDAPDISIDGSFPFVHIETGSVSVQTVVAIPKDLPKISIEIETSNTIDLLIDGPNLRGIRIPKVLLEIAFDVNAEGRIQCLCWLKLETNAPGSIDALINSLFYSYGAEKLNAGLSEIAEGIFDHMLGGAFRFTKARWQNNAPQFDYVTAVLPEKKPSPAFNPIVGHSSPGPGITPVELRNTWRSPLLTNDPGKIKHIVVLMMENRSFDHVLGYLSLERPLENAPAANAGLGNAGISNAINPDVNGLTNKIITQFSDDENKIRHLKFAGFPTNAARLKTKIPFGVGHHYTDVQEQIDNGSMKGFVENFKKKLPAKISERKGTKPQDVLGYYTQEELKMYKYLADEYTVCDNYFCSHPGPTLPNRMYSLTGDLQKDRNGEPKIENDVDTSFLLSRDLNIFDILTQHDVDWRVYESFPSVTMLRMFTRYAGEDKKIKDIANLERDIQRSGEASPFPSVVFIDPAMHDAPANDDHPPADMLHGQHLVKRIYEALRSNKEVWDHTLFIINYDEHGGLFDHVPPKTAEILKKPIDTMGEVNASASAGSRRAAQAGNEIRVGYGVRVPAFIISPYAEKGKVYHQTLDHASVLKTILVRFCNEARPFLSDRVNSAHDMGPALSAALRTISSEPPALPSLPDMRRTAPVKTAAKNFEKMTKGKLSSRDADFHDFLSFLGRAVKPF